MKNLAPPPRQRLLIGALLLGLGLSSGLAQTAENPHTFDTVKGSWTTWWGLTGWPFDHDPSLDAAGDPNSGSLRFEIPFTGAAAEQVMTFGTLANRWAWDSGVVVNTIGAYKNLSLDLKVDPSSAPTTSGNYGNWEFGLVTFDTDWAQVYLPSVQIPLSATNWTHIVVPLDPTKPGAEKVTGFFVKLWSDGAFTNTFIMNIDNVYLEPATNEPPPPPPTMAIQEPAPGLNFIAAGAGQYDRQNIRLISPDYSWVGKGNTPVTYSFDVASFPGNSNPGFELHSYLVPVPPDPGTIGTGSSPDWDQPTAIFMDLQNQADGSAIWTFRWKTNTAGSNATFYDPPLGAITEPAGALGTWTLSFANDTSVTMTSPSGASTNFVFSEDKVAAFKDDGGNPLPLYYYIGAKPQEVANIGLSAAISKASVQGATTPVNSDFLAEGLDTNIWELAAQSAGGVLAVPTNALFLLSWTLPDVGFTLQGTSSLGTGWTDLNLTPQTIGSTKRVLLTTADAGSGPTGFFRLIQRPFVKLQVLLPGETAAPGTATGKTGTPDSQLAGVPFNVTVYAVDENWRRVPTAPADEIALTSTDEGSTMPDNATLAGGSRTFSVTLFSEGNFTFTATDVTDDTKTAATSASVSVTP